MVVSLLPTDSLLREALDRHILVYLETGSEIWLIIIFDGRMELRLLTDRGDEVTSLVTSFLTAQYDGAAAGRLGLLLRVWISLRLRTGTDWLPIGA